MSNPDYKYPIAHGPSWVQAAGLDDINASVSEKTDIKLIARAITNNPRILVTTIGTLVTN